MTHQNPITFLVELAIVVSSLLLAQPASASVFTYQGQLVESGAPIAGPVDLAFRLYDGAAGGVQIGPEVAFNNFDNFALGGEFTVALDFGTGAFPGENRWLEIWVDGQALSPRQAVRPTPYAIHAQIVSDGALPVPYASAVDFSNAGNDFNGSFSGSHSGNGAGLTSLNASNLSTGTVGSGRVSGTYSNAVDFSNAGNDFNGSFSGTHSGSGAGLTSLNASNLSTGTVGSGRVSGTYSNALTLPNAGNSFTGDGGGLMNIDWDNLVNVPPGFADGVDNASDIWNTNGNDAYYDAGNVGIGTSTTNAMLTVGAGDGADFQVGQAPQLYVAKDAVDDKFRIQVAGSGYPGYDLQIGRDDGAHDILLSGMVGIGTSTLGALLTVVSGSLSIRAESSGIQAIVGLATATSDVNIGVHGRSESTQGTGVFGEAAANSGETSGVFGLSLSESGKGVYGLAELSDDGLNYGVYGETSSSNGYGVFSNGDMAASGTKSFVIDHPFDPENKYLKHYAAEGPEPLNVYRGRVTLDGLGEAWVELPAYFAAINRDPLYTLTPIGSAMPNLHVAEEVLNNEFRIAGGAPGKDVSWRVEAVRDDPYVRSRGAPVEVAKGESERGLYQYPEFYGQPPENGINYVLRTRAENNSISGE